MLLITIVAQSAVQYYILRRPELDSRVLYTIYEHK